MIQEIKDYIKYQQPIDFPSKIAILPIDEQFYLWKNIIFKLRNLNINQYEIIQDLFKNTLNLSDWTTQEEQLNSFMCLCKIYRNFMETKHPTFEQEIYTKLLSNPNFIVINKLIILGQNELIYQHSIQSVELTTVLQNEFTQKKRFLKYIILYQVLSLEKYNFNRQDIDSLLFDCLFNAKIKSNTEYALYDVCKDTPNIEQLFQEICKQWSNPAFIDNGSLKTQIYISNLIVLFMKEKYISDHIHLGIEQRLMISNTSSIQRKCGIRVWKQFVKFFNISEELMNEMSDDIDYIPDPVETEIKQIEENNSNLNQSDIQILDINYKQEQEPITVKSILDCIMALRSENKERISDAIKHLPYLIRCNLDVHLHVDTLCNILMNITINEEQEIQRQSSLVALLIVQCAQTSKILLDKYFSDDCSLGNRHIILQILSESVDELSNNPSKYQIEQFDNYNNNEQFHFKKISTKYTIQQQQQQQQFREVSSKRWGHTKRLHENLTIVQPYNNRFHGLTQNIYFPLLIHSPNKHKLLLQREPLLMQNLLSTITKMIGCSVNDLQLIKLIEEAIDFLDYFPRVNDQGVMMQRLRLLLKISILLKSNIIFQYPLVIDKLIGQIQNLENYQEKYDSNVSNLVQMVIGNFKNLFKIQLVN